MQLLLQLQVYVDECKHMAPLRWEQLYSGQCEMLRPDGKCVIRLLMGGGGVNRSESQEETGRTHRRCCAPRWRCIQKKQEEGFQAASCSFTLGFYSHCRHQVHVLYYLWSRTGTAHCLSPTSYQEFEPGKSIYGEKRRVILEEVDSSGSSFRAAGEELERSET